MVFYSRGRQPDYYGGPSRREMYMYGPPRRRGLSRQGWQPPRSYGQWNQYEWEPRGQVQGRFRQGDRMNNLMGHVNQISNGLNMISQLGAVMNSFRGG